MVPESALPGFWKFMYRVSPLTYLIDGLLSTGLARNAVECSPLEFLVFDAPGGGTTCDEYMRPYMEAAGGALADAASTTACRFCQLSTTDVFLATVSSDYGRRWRNYAIMWAYIAFNAVAALALYWLVRVPKGGRK